MTGVSYYFMALMIFIVGLGIIITAGQKSNEEDKNKEKNISFSLGKLIGGGLCLGIFIMLLAAIFLGLLLLLKWLWIGLIG